MSNLRAKRDDELTALATIGDRAAFGELMRRYASSVRMLLRRMGAQPALADDLTQDACLRAFERIATFRNDGAFEGWLKRIAARMYLRRWRRDLRIELVAAPEDLERLDLAPLRTAADHIDLDRALSLLSASERLCVSLCVGAGLTHSEAAAELEIPVGTVKSHVYRGLLKMRAELSVHEPVANEGPRCARA